MSTPSLSDFFSPGILWTPNRVVVPGSWVGHIPFAFWLVGALQPNVFVELGTHSGNSYFSVCQAVENQQLPTACYAVDTWQGDEHSGFYGEEVFAEVSRYHDRKYSSFSRLVRSTFDDAAPHFPNENIDLLHIDGLHTYDAVKHDFETWFPKLSRRAIVLLHDINVRERGFGVWTFWAEMASRYPSFDFLHSHGLGVLGIGPDIPEQVRILFAVKEQPLLKRQVRDLFSRLGVSIQNNSTDIEARRMMDSIVAQLAGVQQHVSDVSAALKQHISDIGAALKQHIDDVNTAIRLEVSTLETGIPHESPAENNDVTKADEPKSHEEAGKESEEEHP